MRLSWNEEDVRRLRPQYLRRAPGLLAFETIGRAPDFMRDLRR